MQADLIKFYNDKKILITGHTTFLGSWLTMLLHNMGAKLTGFSMPPPAYPNMYIETDLHELIHSCIGDVRDFESFNNIVQQHQPEIVIHLSSVCGYLDSVEPKELYTINLLGSLNALEMCRQSANTRVFVNLVPDYSDTMMLKSCGKQNQGELDLVTGSFRSTEFLTTGYRNAYFDPNNYESHHKSVANVRTFPPVGGGDWSRNNLIQEYIHAMLSNKKQLMTRPEKSLYMLHVLDALTGVLVATRKFYEDASTSDVVCDCKIEAGDTYFMDEKWVAQTFSKHWDENEIVIKTDQKQPAAQLSYKGDSSGYIPVSNWTPKWDAETALKKTIEWHQARERGANMQRFSLGQVEEFLSIAPGFNPEKE
jgi:CDP-glucose 4,6-dehydratase